ncbi:hypothetical protein NC653_029682 [Populus alba x Populus x berolinensis]|uniref:Uncharacterized protein n=1 Tax=Populus alba x Populus x berolinensis TaxID=444605 RepID=A0AAD6M347_9ROSI|nr:hypothetical protein NC653_029682 [Populus alba x Populus x berolinensis]
MWTQPCCTKQKRDAPECKSTTGPRTSQGWKREISSTVSNNSEREGRKKRRLSSDECEDTNLEDMNMLKSQLQAQNTSCKLDREQRTGHNDSLVSALNKLTDALVKIADNGSKQRDVNEASYIVVEHYDMLAWILLQFLLHENNRYDMNQT